MNVLGFFQGQVMKLMTPQSQDAVYSLRHQSQRPPQTAVTPQKIHPPRRHVILTQAVYQLPWTFPWTAWTTQFCLRMKWMGQWRKLTSQLCTVAPASETQTAKYRKREAQERRSSWMLRLRISLTACLTWVRLHCTCTCSTSRILDQKCLDSDFCSFTVSFIIYSAL